MVVFIYVLIDSLDLNKVKTVKYPNTKIYQVLITNMTGFYLVAIATKYLIETLLCNFCT
ncbi:hypothetical protein ACN23B_09565 [Anabaena sp. FACHB-709]|nr:MULTISPECIES: hypothetical protein [Nostocaceae]MBD2266571.1 hypothetical protein [Anabaena sp. FACHB-709]MBD2276157.1 hypothetical protein [Nostoc sp. PCC 7120 = FACHB-418]